jgi:hypothetical protein
MIEQEQRENNRECYEPRELNERSGTGEGEERGREE